MQWFGECAERLKECAVRKRFRRVCSEAGGGAVRISGCSEVIKCAVGRKGVQLVATEKKRMAPPYRLYSMLRF